jgi:hypothetical protein
MTSPFVEYPVPRRATVFGLRRGQGLLVGSGVAVGVGLAMWGSLVGTAFALIVIAVSIFAALTPVRGRGVDEWIPVLARFALTRHRSRARHRPSRTSRPARTTPVIVDVASIGVVATKGMVALVAETVGGGLTLLGNEEQRGAVAAFAALLDTAGSGLAPGGTVQFLLSVEPLDDPVPDDVPWWNDGVRRRSWLVLALPCRGSSTAAYEAVAGQLLAIHRALSGPARRAGFELGPPLRARALAQCPPLVAALDQRPIEQFSSVRTGGGDQVSLWIAELPQRAIAPGFLAALWKGSDPLVLSILCRPLPAAMARRTIDAARVAHAANAQLLAKGGYLRTARAARHGEQLAAREMEITRGHGSFDVTAYIRVVGQRGADVEAAVLRIEHLAATVGTRLTRLDGDQARALQWTAPLGLGVR